MKSMCLIPAALLCSALALPALAGQVIAKDGRFEADVSARQMSRIAVLGDKIESVRKIDDPNGLSVVRTFGSDGGVN